MFLLPAMCQTTHDKRYPPRHEAPHKLTPLNESPDVIARRFASCSLRKPGDVRTVFYFR